MMGTQSHRDLLDLKANAAREAYQHMMAEQSAQACCCKRCGQSAALCGQPVKLVPVKLIALYHTLDLLVPIYQCTRFAPSLRRALCNANIGRMRRQPPWQIKHAWKHICCGSERRMLSKVNMYMLQCRHSWREALPHSPRNDRGMWGLSSTGTGPSIRRD